MKYIGFILLLFFSSNGWSAYNANMKGVIKNLMVYTESDYIYLVLENQPTSHQSCNPAYFVISETVPHERRQMLLSRLLMAYASKESINIGYDAQGECVHGYIRLHRAG